MKTKVITTLMTTFLFAVGLYAQSSMSISYEKARYAPAMRWICPEIEKYQGLLISLKNDDAKIYANNVKEKIELYSDPSSPSDKYIITQAILNIENPMYSTENLLGYISTWLKKRSKEWEKKLNVDLANKKISSSASIHVASNGSFLNVNKVYVSPTLIIGIIDESKIMVSFTVDQYKNDEYSGSDNRYQRTYNVKIAEVFPFVQKSSYKNTYAKAYVGTYLQFWNFIHDLCQDLNKDFTRDTKMISQLHYTYAKDSLLTRYGEPTKVVTGLSKIQDIHNEMYFFEQSQKLVFVGKTINFKDIMSCEIVDDPTFIPGHTSSVGAGISFFGIGLGGAETRRTADKTIHNYVVDIKIDNLATPFIRIATGQNEYKATEIASVFEYILRHQQDNTIDKQKSHTVTRKRK